MAKGYFLRIGDKTTCGGEILSGSATLRFHGTPGARAGDKVSCGKYPGIFNIVGGLPKRRNEGLLLAGTLHSVSSCPCRSTFIHTIENGYEKRAVINPYTTGLESQIPDSPDDEGEPKQHAQSARRHKHSPNETPLFTDKSIPAQSDEQPDEPKCEITLTLGVFFDGTGNNAVNTENMLKACSSEHFNLSDKDAKTILIQCGRNKMGISGFGAGSYTGYYTNVHWLNTLYKVDLPAESGAAQQAIYVEGIGTKAGSPDNSIGLGLGVSDTGVIAKTDEATVDLIPGIQQGLFTINDMLGGKSFLIKNIQFDIFGFSRGAAAARHFANRIFSKDSAVVAAISKGLGNVEYHGTPEGKTRFLGIFDTVAAIGTPANGLNPHTADTGDVNIVLRPGVADKVFHITAQNECRYNFALNSVKPAWPELALPGVHSDIGGGYLPLECENLFMTRPRVETVPFTRPGEQTQVFQQTVHEQAVLNLAPTIAPVMRTNKFSIETWYDERMPQDRYGNFQKRSFAALVMRDRVVKNDWSKVVLRVMLDAAQEAGAIFEPIRETNTELQIPLELTSFCTQAIALGKATRSGPTPQGFTTDEIDQIAKNYIHCSSNWDAVVTDASGGIEGGTSAAEIIFTGRPDENWRRSEYNMYGKKLW
ncbi:type VI secretion protein [Enterobacteriaceae bacterium Kacie_13]|nr:type VI secretion protein [Enterobacteriaceae bacterium Kacie_13]